MLRRELVLKNCTTILRDGNHSMLLKLPFVRKNLIEEFDMGGHLKDSI